MSKGELARAFEGRTALVTSASRGIGRAVAYEIGAKGVWVAGTATTVEGADSITDMPVQQYLPGKGYVLDLATPETFKKTVDQIADDSDNPVTLLVNNGGITVDGLSLRMPLEDWKRVIDINLTGPFALTQACLRGMLRAKQGDVVSMGSIIGRTGEAGQVNYAAAKAGLEGMTKSFAREFGKKGLRFNVVAPGYVATDMTEMLPPERKEELLTMIPLGRELTPKEVAMCVADTLGSGLNGETVAINGGLTSDSVGPLPDDR